VQNNEHKKWTINPTISTEGDDAMDFLSCKSTLIVQAKGFALYKVSYTPQTICKTIKVKKQNGEEEVKEEEFDNHKGGFFFPITNRTTKLYRLVGAANAPDAENEIQETVTGKRLNPSSSR
jgi:hypothetical protein